MLKDKPEKWYHAGLNFSCKECGSCCAGFQEGYVWISPAEVLTLADFLRISPEQFKQQYLRRVGRRYSLIEKQPSKDCIFLTPSGKGKKICTIYPLRPRQCRTWPFWKENLSSPSAWADARQVCPGMDEGCWYDCDRIEAIRDGDRSFVQPPLASVQAALNWIKDNGDDHQCLTVVQEIYQDIDRHIKAAAAHCENCGRCCNFEIFGHRLYVTTLEMLYFFQGIKGPAADSPFKNMKLSAGGRCPFQQGGGCSMRCFRPASCRIFYCRDLDVNFQNELTEQALQRLRRLHERYGAIYCYADLFAWLEGVIKLGDEM